MPHNIDIYNYQAVVLLVSSPTSAGVNAAPLLNEREMQQAAELLEKEQCYIWNWLTNGRDSLANIQQAVTEIHHIFQQQYDASKPLPQLWFLFNGHGAVSTETGQYAIGLKNEVVSWEKMEDVLYNSSPTPIRVLALVDACTSTPRRWQSPSPNPKSDFEFDFDEQSRRAHNADSRKRFDKVIEECRERDQVSWRLMTTPGIQTISALRQVLYDGYGLTSLLIKLLQDEALFDSTDTLSSCQLVSRLRALANEAVPPEVTPADWFRVTPQLSNKLGSGSVFLYNLRPKSYFEMPLLAFGDNYTPTELDENLKLRVSLSENGFRIGVPLGVLLFALVKGGSVADAMIKLLASASPTKPTTPSPPLQVPQPEDMFERFRGFKATPNWKEKMTKFIADLNARRSSNESGEFYVHFSDPPNAGCVIGIRFASRRRANTGAASTDYGSSRLGAKGLRC